MRGLVSDLFVYCYAGLICTGTFFRTAAAFQAPVVLSSYTTHDSSNTIFKSRIHTLVKFTRTYLINSE